MNEKSSQKTSGFISPSKGRLTQNEVMEEIAGFIGEDKNLSYKLVIGTDSQTKRQNGTAEVDFVTAIVIHRQGKGGRYFWRKVKKDKVPSLRDKIYTETLFSLELAQEVVPVLKERLAGLAPYELEIHIDVGEVGPTRAMIKEVVGMVTGNGYTAKTKPESYGASSVADRHT